MKRKEYICPCLTVIVVEAERCLAASGDITITGADGLENEGYTDGNVTEGNVKSNFGWDYDW